MTHLRSRWAAIGAAVAVTLGGGGVALVSATSPADAVTFVPITPCRVIDTRPAFQIGPRNTPLGPDSTHDVVTFGNAGECTSVPPNATAVSLNVTTTDATQGTFLTIWKTGATRPNASSLNPQPGQPPIPNAVTTNVDGNGSFSIYNFLGSVHVLADINGYYVDHHHDDRYYTKTAANDRYYTKSQADDRFIQSTGSGTEAAFTFDNFVASDGVIAEVTVDTPTYGYVIVNVNANAQNPFPAGSGRSLCSITTGTTLDNEHLVSSSELASNEYESISGTRAFAIAHLILTGERTYRFVCDNDNTNLANVHLNATFVPDSDARQILLP